MKSIFKKIVLTLCVALPFFSQGQPLPYINAEWRSIQSGLWDINTTWEKYRISVPDWVTNQGGGGPDRGILRTTVRTGHDILWGSTAAGSNYAPQSLGKTFIQPGATVKSYGDSIRVIRLYGDTLQVDGEVGGVGTEGWVNFEAYGGTVLGYATTNKILGTGSIRVYGLRIGAVQGLYGDTLLIGTNVTVDGGVFSAYNNRAQSAAADRHLINIVAGKTVTLIDSAAFHSRNSATPYAQGQVTYNINGTLDMSAATGSSNITANSVTATSTTTVNVNGLVKLGTRFNTVNSAPGAANGSLALNINSGGSVQAIATTVPNGTFMYSPWITNTGGNFRRIVSSADTVFPVRTASSVNNSAMLSFSGTKDTFSVNVKDGFSYIWPASTGLVNREWKITKATADTGNLNAKLMWTAADQNAGFSATAPVSVYVFTGTQWKEVNATLSGAGTTASPYMASVTGLDSFQVLVVGNRNVPFPGTTSGIFSYNQIDRNVSVSPNPVTGGQVALSMSKLGSGTYDVAIYNMAGQKVASQSLQHVQGSTSAYKISLPEVLPAGIYQLTLSSPDYRSAQKLVVQ